MDMNSWITAIITNGIGAVCAAAVLWFAYYRETKTIPNMMATFNSSISEFSKAIAIMQEAFSDRNTQTLNTFTALAREERSNYQKWHEENRERLDNLFIETKEHRHQMRDLAHQMGLRHAVDEERKKRSKGPGFSEGVDS